MTSCCAAGMSGSANFRRESVMTVIVTDSSVYLPRKKAEALHLRVVPMGYTVNGRVLSLIHI